MDDTESSPPTIRLPDLDREPIDYGLEDIRDMTDRGAAVIDHLRGRVFSPDARKTLELRFNVKKAAEMVGRSEKAIREAEAAGDLTPPATNPKTGRRLGYTLADINKMRDHFRTWPWRAAEEEPVILAVQNFKGGVGKSTIVCHLAQYLALKGYRILVIDCDSQASATSLFGLNPDVDVDERQETLYPYFQVGGPNSLRYTLNATYFPGIALIPANLGLYLAEYEFAAQARGSGGAILDRLRMGIDSIKHDFDVILLDPPPALGMMSLSVLRAADALVIPAPPSQIDFASTAHFLRMLVDTMTEIAAHIGERRYKFVKLLATKLNDSKSAQIAIKRMMDHVYPIEMLTTPLKDSAEIDNATSRLRTIYELTGEEARTETHRRCRGLFDAVNQEIEICIRKSWPSHHARLVQEGLIVEGRGHGEEA